MAGVSAAGPANDEHQGDYFDALEILPRAHRDAYYNRKLQEIVAYAYRNAPAMYQKFQEAGIAPDSIRTVKDLERVPVTAKDRIGELRKKFPPFGGLSGRPMSQIPRVYVSPGPIYEPESATGVWDRAYRRAYYDIGFRSGDIALNTWSYHMTGAGHWLDKALSGLGVTVIPWGPGNTELQIGVLRDLQVTCWLGLTSYFREVMKKAADLGFSRKDFALRLLQAGAITGGAKERRAVEQEFGMPCMDVYGIADAGILAYECPNKSGLHIVEEKLVEIVDPATGRQLGPGETGEVVITHFDETYPLVRFGTGDLSYYIDEPCPCGRTSYRLAGVLGRVGEAVKAKGMFIHPADVKRVMLKYPAVARFQVSVSCPNRKDTVVLRLELAGETNRDLLATQISDSFRDICRVKLDHVEFLERGTIAENARIVLDEKKWE